MNYEKKYKEALERAKQFSEKPYLEDSAGIVEYIFPELKESEDDRIRKNIIATIHLYYGEPLDDEAKEMIAWLEKQDIFSKKDIDDAYLKGVRDTKNEIEKQYEANYQIRKDIATFIFNYKGDIKDRAKWMNYLGIKVSFVEKQGEQKPADKVESKFKVGDWILIDNPCQIESIDNNGNYIIRYCDAEETHLLSRNFCDSHFHLWAIQDAKDGDVLVSDDVIFIFNKIHGVWVNCHCSLHKDGSFNDDDYDLMHIKYGKEVYPATKEQRDTLMKAMTDAGYTFDFENKELKKIEQSKLTEFEDAVKDMMDAYRDAIGDCDATTEEVKKHAAYMLSLIPPKPTVGWRPAWSEEDEHRVKDTIYFLDTAKKHYASVIELDACIDWLKSLKDRVGCEANCTTKWKPSEEQMKALAEALSLAKNCGEERVFDLRTLHEQLEKL